MRCDDMQPVRPSQTFRRNLLSPPSGIKSESPFVPEDGGSALVRKFGKRLHKYTLLHYIRDCWSKSPLCAKASYRDQNFSDFYHSLFSELPFKLNTEQRFNNSLYVSFDIYTGFLILIIAQHDLKMDPPTGLTLCN
jgi:hypothetical protein